MWRGARVLVLAALSLLAEPSLAAKKFNLTIGYLPCITGDLRDRQGLTISGALSIALEEVCYCFYLLLFITIIYIILVPIKLYSQGLCESFH